MHLDIQIKKTDEDKHLVFGEFYPSGVPDSDGDFMSLAELEQTAHGLLLNGKQRNVDVQHDGQHIDACVVQSWIQYEPSTLYRLNSWVICVYVEDPAVWLAIRAGELNGFSMEASGWSTPVEVEVELPDGNYTVGETLPGDDGHTHRYVALYNDGGKYIGGETDKVNGHTHRMIYGTITEQADGHNHKYGSPYNFIELQ